uniref:Reverse transcriptase/retrotransposon-derived protein RNase H-like domain-containing protein n=1 Tax=Romanomermis culicivorax TaxID=13658 RepID=A0A915JL56_ROMCU
MTTKKDLAQWCKRFIPKLATLSSPLYGLLHKEAQYIITKEHKTAFEGIKTALTSSPFLHYPVYDGKAQFVKQPDASTTAIGAILYQENRDDQWVIAYNRGVLTHAETHYSTTECKCLAIVYGCTVTTFMAKRLSFVPIKNYSNGSKTKNIAIGASNVLP